MHCPAPRSFVPARAVEGVEILASPPAFIVKPKAGGRGARADGRRYERKAQEHFAATYPSYTRGPWLKFRTGGAWRHCQPDGLLRFVPPPFTQQRVHGITTIIEFKLQHTSAAWWQVRHLYEPVLRTLYPNEEFAALEVCRWFDPHTRFPEVFEIVDDPAAVVPGKFHVLIWRG